MSFSRPAIKTIAMTTLIALLTGAEILAAPAARAVFLPHGPNIATQEMNGNSGGDKMAGELFLMRSNLMERIDAQVQIPALSDKISHLEDPEQLKVNIENSQLTPQKKVLIEKAFLLSRLHILATLLYRRGTLMAVLGDHERAMEDLAAALESDENFAPAYNNRACIKASRGDFDGALADVNQAIALQPDFVEAYDTRGAVYLAKKQYQNAEHDFDRAIAAKPDYAEAFYHRSLLKKALGKESDSELDLKTARFLGYE